ncbi:MAG: glycosyltransferase [Bacteroidia bacterium]|nr:glycosyltransferase [Bacteroidia bacterium]
MSIIISQFNDSYFPVMDGVGMVAHNYALWINRKYGRSYLVAPEVNDYQDDVEYKVFRFKSVQLPGMSPYRIGLPFIDYKFKNKLNNTPVDLVHAHCPFITGQLAKSISVRQNIPLVASFHTKYYDDFMKVTNSRLISNAMIRMIVDFYNSASLVIVPNKATGRTLREYGYKGNFNIISNATDFEVYDAEIKDGYKRKGLELTESGDEEIRFLFVGQLRWEKNVRMIVDSLNILKQGNHPFRMIFAGEGYAQKELSECNEITWLFQKNIFPLQNGKYKFNKQAI